MICKHGVMHMWKPVPQRHRRQRHGRPPRWQRFRFGGGGAEKKINFTKNPKTKKITKNPSKLTNLDFEGATQKQMLRTVSRNFSIQISKFIRSRPRARGRARRERVQDSRPSARGAAGGEAKLYRYKGADILTLRVHAEVNAKHTRARARARRR